MRTETYKRTNGRGSAASLVLLLAIVTAGCHTKQPTNNQSFFTSGSKEADQRASQRMAKSEQLAGSGEDAGEKGVKKAQSDRSVATTGGAQSQQKLSLYERLGSDTGIAKIVDDFMPRLLQDPRVNWARKDVKSGGLFHSGSSAAWTNNAQNVAILKKHIVQFLALATGGPAHYQGKEIKADHANMRISNPEFDAAVGDIKASLDNLQVPNKEQKEFIAIIESTRPQIVTQR
jgi:hemoglobin